MADSIKRFTNTVFSGGPANTTILSRMAVTPLCDTFTIEQKEAILTTSLLLRPKGINWISLGQFLKSLHLASPLGGTVDDFKVM